MPVVVLGLGGSPLKADSDFRPSLIRRGRMVYNQSKPEGHMTRCSVPGDTIWNNPVRRFQ